MSKNIMSIRVSIVEDKTDIRQALEQIIDMAEGYEMVSSYRSGEEAMAGLPVTQPDLVLMDINLGGMTGIECVRLLKAEHPGIKFMMCTVYEEDEQIFEALRAGASGYILKKTPPARLLEALKELYEGGAPMSSQIAARVVNAFQTQKPVTEAAAGGTADAAIATLSNREREILDYLSKGLLYKEIAAELGISQETVRKHVYNIYEKLHVGNRIEAVNKLFGR
jgi:RNA polymerase sigma factor (sigma-70 family)